MGHEDVGHFADKHPKGTTLDPSLAKSIQQRADGDELTCAAAHAIAEELSISPDQVGIAMDLMEIRIGKCQMGLFGYRPQKRIVKPAESVPPQLEEAIQSAERLRTQVEKHHFYFQERDIQVTLSIGVARFPDHAKEKKSIIKMADDAMYSGKKNGRNIVFVAEKSEQKQTDSIPTKKKRKA